MKHIYNNLYESPELSFLVAETEGFLCSSRLGVAEDEFNSNLGDEGPEGATPYTNGYIIIE